MNCNFSIFIGMILGILTCLFLLALMGVHDMNKNFGFVCGKNLGMAPTASDSLRVLEDRDCHEMYIYYKEWSK